MVYIYKEYQHIFDTPAKMEQESVVASKIMDLLNKNKYDNIYDFINKNQTYQDFLKRNDLTNVVKHFGNTLTEDDFKRIQSELVKLYEKKKSFEKDNIKTTNIDDKQYTSYEGEQKTYFFDNSNTNMSLERQMEELQKTEQKFQTSDPTKNTENMMTELENNKKENLNFIKLNELDITKLNDVQKEFVKIAANYQLSTPQPIRIDIERGIIVDEFNNIMKIEKNGNEFSIIGDNNSQKENLNTEDLAKEKTFQKTLTPSLNTIYSNNKEK